MAASWGLGPQPRPAAAASERRALFASFSGTKRKDPRKDAVSLRKNNKKGQDKSRPPTPYHSTTPSKIVENFPNPPAAVRGRPISETTLRVVFAWRCAPSGGIAARAKNHPHAVPGTGVVCKIKSYSSIFPNISKSSLSLMRVLRAGAWGLASGSRGAPANSRPGTLEFRGPPLP